MLYTYRAVDQSGKTVSGEREAGSERELADMLRHDSYLLLEAKLPAKAGQRFEFLKRIPMPFRRISLVERMGFSRNLAVMIGAGLALTRALEALAEQTSNPKFREIVTSIRDSVTTGKSFADSLRSHEKVFGVLFINMVEAGEISGNLERALKILAQQMKRDYDLRSKVRSAMIYPAIVVGALVLIGVLMMVYVVPTLTQTFQELEIELPLTTRVIIGTSNFLLRYYWYILAVAGIGAMGMARLLRSQAGKSAFDTIILRVPIFGVLVQKYNSARFARTLSSLIASGIPITRALEVTASVLGNSHFRQSFEEAAKEIQHGKPISEILRRHPNLFPPMVTQMVEVGEETGTIVRMLLRLALFYEEEVTNTTKNLSSIIEPVLMIVIGAIVGFFAVSMIQPIYGSLGNI
ncbi:MAG: type II secretion system F family protein [Candidatus Sungbacteria bacterium]|uniref:Type II secretion system F family protein n=1 Tax=Candidatus Sungiibacteriota bacterium TaxID=2750080 RepID=A0A932YXW5_9BACT|nr:type II secretion system F family protein [Candidatus Sungbacteria bacterium]